MDTCPVCNKPDLYGHHHACYTVMLAEYPELREIARNLYYGNLTGAQKLVQAFYAKHRHRSQYDPSDNDVVEI